MTINRTVKAVCYILCAMFIASCSLLTSLSPSVHTDLTPGIDEPTPVNNQAGLSPEENATQNDQDLVHLWAENSTLYPLEVYGVAVGAPEDTLGCGSEFLSGYEEPEMEVTINLNYAQALIPEKVNLVLKEMNEGITRVEILNTRTGLGREIFRENLHRSFSRLENQACALRLELPVEIDFEVNTVIIGFKNLAAAALLDAVELVGSPLSYEEPPVAWRVALNGKPLSLTVDPLNQVWVSLEPNIILRYDVEGNLLEELPAIPSGHITDMAINTDGDLVLNDEDFGEYIILSKGVEVARGGGDAPTLAVAVEPGKKNIYMLGSLDGLYYLLNYLPNSYEINNPLTLVSTSYTTLAFNSANQLFTIRDQDGFLAEIDENSGLEFYSIPLSAYNQPGVLPKSMAIDKNDNFYVLFSSNPENAAVKVYDVDGFYFRSFGKLINQPLSQWPEGRYVNPVDIALSPDSRFVFIIDGEGDTNYLTCLLLQAE